MSRLAVLGMVLSLFGVACSSETPEESPVIETDSIESSVAPVEMPAFPTVDPGKVAMATSHGQTHYVVNNSWDAWVGRCDSSGIVQVVVSTDSYGVVILLSPSSSDSSPVSFPVMEPNDSTPEPESARVALQIYPEDRAYVLKGVAGTVDIDTFTPSLSGRLSTRLVEATYRDTVLAAASFADLPIESVGEEYCRAIDSPAPPTPGDSIESAPVPIGQAERQ